MLSRWNQFVYKLNGQLLWLPVSDACLVILSTVCFLVQHLLGLSKRENVTAITVLQLAVFCE